MVVVRGMGMLGTSVVDRAMVVRRVLYMGTWVSSCAEVCVGVGVSMCVWCVCIRTGVGGRGECGEVLVCHCG